MQADNSYHICNRCIMDTSDPKITFDKDGICNHCHHYKVRAGSELFLDDDGQKKLKHITDKIKSAGRRRKYDCVIGVSGGMDSSTAIDKLCQLGLRPLAIHLDNGWNSELSVKNVEQIIKKLKLDLFTHVLDWEEFRDLQVAFLKASISNAEIPTDHAIVALLFHVAAKEGIKYIISGGNIVTEAIMPESWMYDAKDLKLLNAVHRKYGNTKLKTFPKLSFANLAYYTFIKGIKYFPILNYISYNKKEAREHLNTKFCWKDYGGKHFESVYTRFFQGYILPKKFNIDKRRAHYSTLINSGQMKREEALNEIEKPPYPIDDIEADRQYIIKKLGISDKDFEIIMSSPAKTHHNYPNNEKLFVKMRGIVKIARKMLTIN